MIRVMTGRMTDRYGGEPVAVIAFVITLIGSCIITATPDFTTSVIATMIMAVGMGMNNAATFKMVSKFVPEAVGGCSGWVGSVGAFSGFLFPPIMGAISDSAGYPAGWCLYVIFSALSLIASIFLFWQARQRKAQGAQPPKLTNALSTTVLLTE